MDNLRGSEREVDEVVDPVLHNQDVREDSFTSTILSARGGHDQVSDLQLLELDRTQSRFNSSCVAAKVASHGSNVQLAVVMLESDEVVL